MRKLLFQQKNFFFNKKTFLLIASLLVISSHCWSDELEVIAGLDPQKDLPVINKILREQDKATTQISDMLQAGTSGQVLTSNGDNTAPTYQTKTPTAYTDAVDTESTDDTTVSATYEDTNLSITFTPGAAGLCIANFSGSSDVAGGAGNLGYALVVDDTIKHEVVFRNNTAFIENPISLGWSGSLTAASHTIKVQFKTAAGTETLLGSTNAPARLTVSYPT